MAVGGGGAKQDDNKTTVGGLSMCYTAKTLYRKFNKIFPEKELRSICPNFYIHISVSDLYIPTVGLPFWLLQENRWTDRGNI